MKDHVRRGRRARDAGQWAEAYAAYKAAFEAADPASSTERERAELAGELGLCELALRRYRDAAEHLAFSLEQRTALPLALQLRFEKGEREATKHVATLVLSVDPPDAEVLVDGKWVGRVARTYKLFLEPGQRIVRASAPGREDRFHEFGAVAATRYNVRMPLARLAVSQAPESAPASPKATQETRSSSPVVRARAPSPWASWPGTLRIAGITATTATLSAGAVLMIRASSLDGDAREQRDGLTRGRTSSSSMCWQASRRSSCGALRRLLDERNLSDGLGTALLITGGVLGAATAASFFTDLSFLGHSPAQERIHVSPVATGRETGVRIEGSW
ncbi:hypothetical protein [Sorangium sp. So ce426]|uniref:hypothetical protein n=1 Tax=Sorangium sp. So ce426 TaxID=3133312 RepID=UPI003F5B601F